MYPTLIPRGSRALADFEAEYGADAVAALPPHRLISWNHQFFVLPERANHDHVSDRRQNDSL